MIVVDSSVWIEHFGGRHSTQVDTLDSLLARRRVPILIGDLVMYEVLCGLRSAREVARVKRWFEQLLLVSMLNFDLVPRAVANHQTLRSRGITPGTIDMIIGTFCLEHGAELLTSDRDFEPMRDHLGLRLLASA